MKGIRQVMATKKLIALSQLNGLIFILAPQLGHLKE